ncbi:MAG TPA: hypothetical protein VGM80_09655 [Gaiellaceae bacterium]
MRRASSTTIALLVAGVLAGAGLAASTPSTLVSSLRSAAYPDISLPAAFSSARVAGAPPASHSRANGAVGEVDVDVDGPDPTAGIVFIVFRTAAGAQADLANAPVATAGLAIHAAGKVVGHSPSAMFTGSITQTDALNDAITHHVTVAAAVQGNVLVAGFTYAVSGAGNVHGALRLMTSGLNHLKKVSHS